MKKIGITGGIGSGKTTICEIFKLLGIAVFHADEEVRNLQNSDLQIRNHLVELLGGQIYDQDGILDRKKMAGIIFTDQEALAAVNKIIHPAIRQRFLKWTDNHLDDPYVLYEAAVLIESGFASDFYLNILVLADEKVRIERVMKRDNTTKGLVKQRIMNQMPDNQKIKMVDYVIENNNMKLVIPQIIRLDKLIKAESNNWKM